MGIEHRRAHVAMSKQFLTGAKVVARFEQTAGERVPQRVTIGLLGQPDFPGCRFDGPCRTVLSI
jgi:hypothetical protein